MDWYSFAPAPSKAQRIANAAKEIAQLRKKGRQLDPAAPAGSKLAETFWGQAWNKNLESYADYETRLPRGRSYLRANAVLDLRVESGLVRALVLGTDTYEVKITVQPLAKAEWEALKDECGGRVANLLDLLQGRLPAEVMAAVTRKDGGLFPKPGQIKIVCSCPDSAGLCKHAAAALYGVGARLDRSPEMLFRLRGVDHTELLGRATETVADLTRAEAAPGLAGADLSEMFGIDLDLAPSAPAAPDGNAEPRGLAAPKPQSARSPAAKMKPVPKPKGRASGESQAVRSAKKPGKKAAPAERAGSKGKPARSKRRAG